MTITSSSIRTLIADIFAENDTELPNVDPRDELKAIYESELASFSVEAEKFAKRIESAEALQKNCIEYHDQYWKKFRNVLGNLEPEFASVLMRENDIQEIRALPDRTGVVKRSFQYCELFPIYGNLLFKFAISDHLAKSPAYHNFTPGLLSPILAHYGKRDTVERVWVTLGFGPPIARQSAMPSKDAIVDAFHKLLTYLGTFRSEKDALSFISKQYISTAGIGTNDVIDIICLDSKTLLQEFCHFAGIKGPQYQIERSGGPDHAPIMSGIASFEGMESSLVESVSKQEASVKAAADLLEKVASSSTYRPRLQQLIRDKYFRRRKYAQKQVRCLPTTLARAEELRKAIGCRQSAEGLIAAFTLKSDVAKGQTSRDNERDAFFGSQLEAFLTVRPHLDRFTQRSVIRNSLVPTIDNFHSVVGNHHKKLSEAQRRNIAQSVIYGECRESGLEAAASLFEEIFERRKTHAQIGNGVPDFDPGVPFTTSLYELIHKRNDPDPKVEYRLLTEANSGHDPRYECSIEYAGHIATGVDRNKVKSRNKASHAMLLMLAGAA
jgi:dsRNA-specific ribonuclease